MEDALLSLAITKVLFDEVDYSLINSFQRDEHRQEEIIDNRGRLWVNDSKATNIDATIQALKGYKESYIRLIIGGEDKGVDLSPLFKLMQTLNITIYTIGKNHQKLYDLAQEYSIDAQICNNIENAIIEIDREYQKDDISILSPAGASFDQFKSYKHRGETFKELIKTLKN